MPRNGILTEWLPTIALEESSHPLDVIPVLCRCLKAAPGLELVGGVGWDTVGYWPLAIPIQQHPEVTAKEGPL